MKMMAKKHGNDMISKTSNKAMGCNTTKSKGLNAGGAKHSFKFRKDVTKPISGFKRG